MDTNLGFVPGLANRYSAPAATQRVAERARIKRAVLTSSSSRRARPGDLLAAVALERPRRGELAELVPDHVLLDVHAQELVAVVDLERVPDELRDDRACPGPRLDRLLGAPLVEQHDLLVKLLGHERTFFCASAHGCSFRYLSGPSGTPLNGPY